jgi:hypothetical protein
MWMRLIHGLIGSLLLGGCVPAAADDNDTTDTTVDISGSGSTSDPSTPATTGGEPTTGDSTTADSTTADSTTGAAGSCPDDDVVVHDQAALEALAGCTHITGSLLIYDDVTSLAPLAALTRIDHDLAITTEAGGKAPPLTTLTGLEGLTSIGGSVRIGHMPGLTSLLPLSGLQELPGGFYFNFMPNLSSLEGLHNLTAVGSIGLVSLPALTDLAGLRSVEATFRIHLQQVGITDLQGLEALTELTVELSANDNPNLQSLAGLEAVDWNGLSLSLTGNSVLTDLGALTGVEQMVSINLVENGLTDLVGLESLTNVEIDLVLSENLALADLGALAKLESVDRLLLNSLPISDLAGLASLVEVRELFVWSTEIVTLGPLPALQQVGDIELHFNPALVSLAGLSGISSLGRLQILDNDALPTLGELTEVVTAESLGLLGNAALVDLAGLGALAEVDGQLYIRDNPALTSVAGLTALTKVGDRLSILFNSSLPQADAAAWGAGVDVAGIVKIAGNKDAPGPADPCPWPNDGECDEEIGLCVAGSDMEDCV